MAVIPAQAGTPDDRAAPTHDEVPALAGMTNLAGEGARDVHSPSDARRMGLHHDQQAARPAVHWVTADLAQRVWQHRIGEGSKFCRKYNLTRLVYAEEYPTIEEAIAREKAMKEWKRDWKIELVERQNPEWRDMWEDIVGA